MICVKNNVPIIIDLGMLAKVSSFLSLTHCPPSLSPTLYISAEEYAHHYEATSLSWEATRFAS